MSSAKLRNRIAFLEEKITENKNGFKTKTWNETRRAWARISNLSGKEYYAAAAVNRENTLKILIRYTKGIDASMRIAFKDKLYNIVSVENVRYENKYIEIKAVEV